MHRQELNKSKFNNRPNFKRHMILNNPKNQKCVMTCNRPCLEHYQFFVRDRSEITGGGGHYLCREGHNFFEQNFGRVTIFLPKLREGNNFFKAKPADLNVLVTIFQLTGPSA